MDGVASMITMDLPTYLSLLSVTGEGTRGYYLLQARGTGSLAVAGAGVWGYYLLVARSTGY